MSAKRKTVNVKDMIKEVNRINKCSSCHPEQRKGINSFLEHFLMETGNYAGFGYWEQKDLEPPATETEGQLPGIILNADGPGKHQFPDESRRFYYCK